MYKNKILWHPAIPVSLQALCVSYGLRKGELKPGRGWM